MRFLFILIVFVLTYIFSVICDRPVDELVLFWNFPSFIIVFVPAFIASICATSGGNFTTVFRVIFSNSVQFSELEIKNTQIVFSIIGNISLMIGFFGIFVGAVKMLVILPNLTSVKYPAILGGVSPNILPHTITP